MYIKSYKYIIVAIGALSISIYLFFAQSNPNPDGLQTKSAIAEDNRNGIQSTEDKDQKYKEYYTKSDSAVSDGPTDKTNEVIENIVPSRINESRWMITDDKDNPRVGVHVVCTPISPELVQEWLAIEDEGAVPKPELIETYTDDKGCFDFPLLESSQYLIRADAPHWSPALGILDFRLERPVDFSAVMVKEKKLRGKVLDCHQQPIQKATVFCYMTPTYPIENMPLHCAGEVILFKKSLLTDEEGKFDFCGLYPKLNYNLYVEYEDCKPQYKIVSGKNNNEQIIVLKKSCIIEGRITSSSGEALSDAEVMYIDPQSPYVQETIDIIDDEGHFRCDDIPEGFINLLGMHNDYGHELAKIYIKPDRINYVDLELPEGFKLQVKVTDEKDRPLNGIIVTVQSQDSGACLLSCTTDESGEIVVYSLNKGDYNLIRTRDPHSRYSVYKKSHSFNSDAVIQISLKKRIHAQLVVIDKITEAVLSNYKACVCSYYKSSALQEVISLESHTVEFKSNKPTHDFVIAEGEFYEITVLADGYMPERIIAMSPSGTEIEPFKVFLKPGKVFHGCVVDAITLKPIPDASIQFYLSGRYDKKPCYPISNDRFTTTSEDGLFSLSGMPDHPFFLKAKAPGYAPVLINSLELNHKLPAIKNLVYLKRGGSLIGRIFSEEELPLDQANVQVKLPDTNEISCTKTSPDGSYVISGLPPAKYEVSVWETLDTIYSNSTMKLQKSVEIWSGQISSVDFYFEGSCVIRGLCTVNGKEGCGIIIHLYNDKGFKTHSIDASSTGFYKISSIVPGSYILEAYSTVIGEGGVIRRPLTIQSGQDLKIDFDFKGKSVCGTVTDAKGEPIHAAEVELLTTSFFRSYLTYTDHEGNYAIYNVEKGNYFIGARAPGCAEELKGPWLLNGKGKQARNADFVLKPGGTVRVHVINSIGSPLANAKILISNNMNQGVLWSSKTKYSGMAVFDNLQTESLTAIAICPGYAPASTTFIAPAGEITDAEVRLVKGGSCEIQVKTTNGLPISEAQVTLIGYSQLGLSLAKLIQLGLLTVSSPAFLTNDKGLFTLGLLPPGDYKIRISKGLRTIDSPLNISSDQEASLEVILQ